MSRDHKIRTTRHCTRKFQQGIWIGTMLVKERRMCEVRGIKNEEFSLLFLFLTSKAPGPKLTAARRAVIAGELARRTTGGRIGRDEGERVWRKGWGEGERGRTSDVFSSVCCFFWRGAPG